MLSLYRIETPISMQISSFNIKKPSFGEKHVRTQLFSFLESAAYKPLGNPLLYFLQQRESRTKAGGAAAFAQLYGDLFLHFGRGFLSG
jgi:hypothetical protein